VKNKVMGYEADDFLHVMVVPDNNDSLLHRTYKCSGTGLYETWTRCINHPGKFVIISPKALWAKQDENSDLYQYLKTRYW